MKGWYLINRESIDAIWTAVWKLEKARCITASRTGIAKARWPKWFITIYEQP